MFKTTLFIPRLPICKQKPSTLASMKSTHQPFCFNVALKLQTKLVALKKHKTPALSVSTLICGKWVARAACYVDCQHSERALTCTAVTPLRTHTHACTYTGTRATGSNLDQVKKYKCHIFSKLIKIQAKYLRQFHQQMSQTF